MRSRLVVFCIALLAISGRAQINCETSFAKDTMSLLDGNKIVEGEYIETTLKDQSQFRILRTDDDKYYLRFVVKKNFYFNKTDVLEIRSGSKSYYVKNTTQHKVNKTTGIFVVEIFKNYLMTTLKDEGISSLYFAQAETDFTRQDTKQIKEISRCFYTKVTGKK